jgi:hypothetical protein
MTLRKWWKLFLNIIYCWGLEYFCNKSLTLPLNSLHCSPTAWHMHGRHSYMYKAWRYTHISLYSRSVIEHPLKVRCQSSHAIKKQVLLFCCWRETVNACIYIFFPLTTIVQEDAYVWILQIDAHHKESYSLCSHYSALWTEWMHFYI